MTSQTATKGEATVALHAPGMTSLHRVGVAGLWMTLEALDTQPELKHQVMASGGTWQREPDGSVLRWDGGPSAFFAALLEVSFRLDARGLVQFTGLGTQVSNAHRVLLQDAMLETFLQHGRTRKAGATTLLVTGDEDADQPPLTYRPLEWYAHQRAAKDLKIGRAATLAGWNFPGGAVRHSGFAAETALSEPLDRYLALLFAPVGAFFYRLRSRRPHRKPRFCLVLPDISDLQRYMRARRMFAHQSPDQFIAAGGAEASLRVALLLRSEHLLDNLRASSLRAIEFGRVAWDSKQKYRVGLFQVTEAATDDLEAFRRAEQALPPRIINGSSGSFWSAPQTPELIASNLVRGDPWWFGFAEFVDHPDRRNAVFGFERKGLSLMTRSVQEHTGASLGETAAEIFVHACHAAWRRRLGRLFERARNEGMSASDLIGREFDEQRIAFARCKNAATLRAVVTDFWARAGGALAPLQSGWQQILPFLTEQRWQEGRDLALLALASYSSTTREEDEAIRAAVANQVTAVDANPDEER